MKPLRELGDVVVPALREVYDLNASRHDLLAGDDAMTFGFAVYRNSWFTLEQQLREQPTWRTARPDGSLTISGHGYTIHVYRVGADERVDLDSFRLDDGDASATKRLIPATNGQLTLDFPTAAAPDGKADLRSLVIVHAGNPDDGCCGVWIGGAHTCR